MPHRKYEEAKPIPVTVSDAQIRVQTLRDEIKQTQRILKDAQQELLFAIQQLDISLIDALDMKLCKLI